MVIDGEAEQTTVSKTSRVVQAMQSAARPMLAHSIARASGLSTRDVAHALANLRDRGIAERSKLLSSGSGYFWWSLRPGGFERWAACRGARLPVADVVTVPSKLAFLRRLRDLPAFSGAAVIDHLIADYERALRMSAKEEQ